MDPAIPMSSADSFSLYFLKYGARAQACGSLSHVLAGFLYTLSRYLPKPALPAAIRSTQGTKRWVWEVWVRHVECWKCPWPVGRVHSKVFPVAHLWVSWWIQYIVNRTYIPLIPAKDHIWCFSQCSSHFAHNLVFWMEEEKSECIWHCPAELRKPDAHSHALFFPHRRNYALRTNLSWF